MAFDQWLIFVAIWTLAGLPLGPNALNCIAVSARIGFTRSLWSVAGILGAALCHKTAVIFGAATILLANAELFYVLKFCGAAYLIWMGISLRREGGGRIYWILRGRHRCRSAPRDSPSTPDVQSINRHLLYRRGRSIGSLGQSVGKLT